MKRKICGILMLAVFLILSACGKKDAPVEKKKEKKTAVRKVDKVEKERYM